MRAWSGVLAVLVWGLACDEQFTAREESAAGASGMLSEAGGAMAGAGTAGDGAGHRSGGNAGEGSARGGVAGGAGEGAAARGGATDVDGGTSSGGAGGVAGAGHAGVSSSGGGPAAGGLAGEGGSGAPSCPELLSSGDFEGSASSWDAASTTGRQLVYSDSDEQLFIAPRSGSSLAWLGAGADDQSALSQTLTIPMDAEALTLRGFIWISSEEYPGDGVFDVVRVELTMGPAVALAGPDWSNEDETIGWQAFQVALDVRDYRGTELTFRLYSSTDAELVTHFWFDDLSLRACEP